jgi:hypothetical protein
MSAKVNKTLYSVANRSDFKDPMLGGGPAFFPHAEVTTPPDEKEVRDILKLNFKTNDYYVIGILHAIESFPEISELFKDPVKTYSTDLLEAPGPAGENCNMIADSNGPPFVRIKADRIPVSFRLNFEYVDANYMFVRNGQTTHSVRYTQSENVILWPRWPESLDIRGGIRLNSPWSPGNRAGIDYWPLDFPYELLSETLRSSQANDRLILSSPFINAYYATRDPMERVALSAAALGLNNSGVF